MGEDISDREVHDLRIVHLARGVLLGVLSAVAPLLVLWALDVPITLEVQVFVLLIAIAIAVVGASVRRSEHRLRQHRDSDLR